MAENPDAVIVATGSRPIVPMIPGHDGPNVADALDVLSGKRVAGETCVIIGGGKIGCETAEFLLEQGRKVTILEMLPRLGKGIGPAERFITITALRQAGAALETGTKAVEIAPAGVSAVKNGENVFFPGESVIIAVGMAAEDALTKALQGRVADLYTIGDCVEPRRIGDAIKDAYRCAQNI
jgi:pyruvate/2-oxoglutarate dehydrogenase complex dihydrolipoamide dehydrogenase (E3) component